MREQRIQSFINHSKKIIIHSFTYNNHCTRHKSESQIKTIRVSEQVKDKKNINKTKSQYTNKQNHERHNLF